MLQELRRFICTTGYGIEIVFMWLLEIVRRVAEYSNNILLISVSCIVVFFLGKWLVVI